MSQLLYGIFIFQYIVLLKMLNFELIQQYNITVGLVYGPKSLNSVLLCKRRAIVTIHETFRNQ